MLKLIPFVACNNIKLSNDKHFNCYCYLLFGLFIGFTSIYIVLRDAMSDAKGQRVYRYCIDCTQDRDREQTNSHSISYYIEQCSNIRGTLMNIPFDKKHSTCSWQKCLPDNILKVRATKNNNMWDTSHQIISYYKHLFSIWSNYDFAKIVHVPTKWRDCSLL